MRYQVTRTEAESESKVGLKADVLNAGRMVMSGGVFYGWWLVGLASFMLTLMSLTVFQGLGTMLVALERQYGWSRTALSGAFSLARVEGRDTGPNRGRAGGQGGGRAAWCLSGTP